MLAALSQAVGFTASHDAVNVFDFSKIESGTGPDSIYFLSGDTRDILLSLIQSSHTRFDWLWDDIEPTDTQWDTIDAALSEAVRELFMPLIGAMIPSIKSEMDGAIFCDGATHLRVDYPLLYAILPAAMIVDGDHFTVPFMQNKTVVGADPNGEYSVASEVGEQSGDDYIYLDVPNLPAHSHTTQPHTHGYSAAQASVLSITAGVPTPAALAVPAVTDASGVTVDETGDFEPYVFQAPRFRVNWFIVAG